MTFLKLRKRHLFQIITWFGSITVLYFNTNPTFAFDRYRKVTRPISTTVTEALPIVRGSIWYRDDRIHYLPNDSSQGIQGSILTSTRVDRPLRYVNYEILQYCFTDNELKFISSYSGITDKDGKFVKSMDWKGCKEPRIRMRVTFKSTIKGKNYHSVDDFKLGKTYTVETGYKKLNSNTINFNVSCPNLLKTSSTGFNCTCTDKNGDGMCDDMLDDNHGVFYHDRAHKVANIYETGIDVYNVWGFYDGRPSCQNASDPCNGPYRIRWPHDKNTNNARGFSKVHIRETSWLENHRIAHEIGHMYQMRTLGLGGGKMAANMWGGDDWGDTCINGKHEWDSDEYELSGTIEGWAYFFAAATYFEKNATHPYYRWCGDGTHVPNCPCRSDDWWLNPCTREALLEGKTMINYHKSNTEGFCLEARCSYNKDEPFDECTNGTYNKQSTEGNIARFFWDLYDDTNIGEQKFDNTSFTTSYMLKIWEKFPEGTSNRRNDEPRGSKGGVVDNCDGRNAFDYKWVECNISLPGWPDAGSVGHCEAGSEFENNCLTGQDES